MATIYQQEINDGLSKYFEKPLSIAYVMPIALSAKENFVGKVKSVSNVVGKLKEDEFLYEYPAILVSAGVWNLNDQIFDKFEVWKAKYTPINKPANLNHQPDKVVGHTNKVFAITDEEEAKVIPTVVDGKPNEDIPDIYHLLTVDSFYKYNIKAYQAVNEEYSKTIDEIYKKIVDGKLCVSMECIFADFDYGIIDAEGNQQIIKRTDKSSFLTKKLRHFGGSGVYDGYKIGMLMRDMIFTGKGITDNPANEASVIFGKDTLAFSSKKYTKSEDIFNTEKNSAYISSDNGEQKMKLEDLQAKITELEAALAEANKAKTDLESAKAELVQIKDELTKVTESAKATKEELDTIKKTANETNNKLAEAEKEVNVLKAEKIKNTRIASIKDTLSLTNEESEIQYVVIASLTDEAFNAWLKNTKELVSKKNNSDELAKAKKEVEEINKKLAEAQLAAAKKEEPNLGVPNKTEEDVNAKLLDSVKSVFKNK